MIVTIIVCVVGILWLFMSPTTKEDRQEEIEAEEREAWNEKRIKYLLFLRRHGRTSLTALYDLEEENPDQMRRSVVTLTVLASLRNDGLVKQEEDAQERIFYTITKNGELILIDALEP